MPRTARALASIILLFGPLRAEDLTGIFEPADRAFAAGNFAEGTRRLEDLVASRPGDFAFARQALHRACLADYFRLIATDWPSGNMAAQLLAEAGDQPAQIWPRLSAYLEEALLEIGKFAPDGETYVIPAPKILESLWRRRTDYPLSPIDEVSDTAAERILTLSRLGHIDDSDPALIDASLWLTLLRKQQNRHLEATQLIDHLVEVHNSQIDWLLARAKYHAQIHSPRAQTLTDELYSILDHPTKGAEPASVRARRRTEGLRNPSDERRVPAPRKQPAGQSWLAQMLPDTANSNWKRLANGLINGIEEPVHIWIQETFSEDQNRAYMKRLDGCGSAMAWRVIDHQLQSIGPPQLQALAKLQEDYCGRDPRYNAIKHAEPDVQLAFYRAYPWAPTAHTGLLAYAKGQLEAGRAQAAHSAFQDLLDHSADTSLRKQAQVGIWVTLALGEEFAELRRSIAEAGSTPFPWMDAQATPKEIHNRLLQAIPRKSSATDEPTPLAELRPQVLKLPAQQLWPQMNHRKSSGLEFVQLQRHGDHLLASTRNLLAWYDAKAGGNPLWTSQCGGQWNNSIGRPGISRPLLSKGRIYARWGYEADPQQLVALDIRSRDILWSLDATGPAQAKRRMPLGNPARSSDQIYVASGWDMANAKGGYNFRISSINLSSGTPNWHADLSIQRLGRHKGNNTFEGILGDCLTVHKGKLYCSPGTGFLARFDAKDGRLEWMYNYKSLGLSELQEDTLGSAPLLMDGIVVGLPRDSNTLVGLDAQTGSVRWRTSSLLPKQIIGPFKDTILLHGHSMLAAIEARTGKVIWRIPHPEPMLDQATLQGSSLHLASQHNLYRFDATTGIQLETRPLPPIKSTIRHATIHGQDLYIITDEPSSDLENPFLHKAPGDALWEIRAANPRIYHPTNDEPDNGTLLIHQNEILHCLDAAGTGKILWQRFLYPAPSHVYFLEGKVVLSFHKDQNDLRLQALDLQYGHPTWERIMPRLRAGHGAMYGRHKHLLYGRDNTDGFHLLDLNTGKILRQARIDRRNGTAKGGIGNEQIQFMIAAYDKNLFWLNWNAQTNTLEGAGETLRGAHGEPARPFDNVTHIDARFGSRSSYFVCNQNGQFAAYRADYRDRSVHLVRQGVRNLKFAPPFLLLQDGDAGHNRHRWTLRREDAPAYAHTLELAHTWQGQSTFINGRLLEVIPRQQQQPPALRIHDLHARKTLLTHSEPDSEKMGALPAGPDRILLYAYQRNKRDPAPYFRLTTYDLKTGQPGPTQTIDYWATTHHHPQEIRIVGKLLLARDPHALRAWELRI